MRRQLFRGRGPAASAAATTALLVWMEASDLLRPAATSDRTEDRGTSRNFLLATGTAVVASSVEMFRLAPMPRHPRRWWAGIAIVWTGAVINRTARAQLGNNYRSRLTVVDGHELVSKGPYAVVRHPMYTGSCLICVGTALAVSSPLAVLAWSLPVLALVHRVHEEEGLLRDAFGSGYDASSRSRARLIPGVW